MRCAVGLLLAASLAGCGGSGGGSGSGSGAAARGDHGGMVMTFGLRADNAGTAAAITAQFSTWLAESGIAGAALPARVACPPGAGIGGQTAACYDARILLPFVPSRSLELLAELQRSNDLARRLEDDDRLGPAVSFVERRGLAWGNSAALLFSLRGMLDVAPPLPGAAARRLRPPRRAAATTSGAAYGDTVTVDSLIWTDSTTLVAKDSDYELRVLAPGFGGASGSSGTWVLDGLGARVKNGDLKCLRGRFRELATGETALVDAGDCTDMEQYVELAPTLVATGVSMKVSDNKVKGVGLGSGTPTYTVDALVPDFLTGVSPSAYVFSGSSSGTYAPEAETLTANYPYVVVGVAAKATDSNVSGLTAYVGRLTAPEPDAGDLWQGHTVGDVEAAMTTVLNEVYDVVADTLTFEAVANCTSTIPSIRFCDALAAEDSYSSSEMDSVCAGTCDAFYESCKVSKDACEVACCYGCPTGKWCSCNYDCGKERDACYDGCTNTFTGSARVDVERVTGLETLRFTDASVPFIVEGTSVGVTADAEVSPGLTAEVFWRLCQSGICVSDTTPMSSSTMRLSARGVLTAAACPSGPPALYLTIDEVEIIDPGIWDLDQLVDDISGALDSTMDWLAENVSDLFETDLDDDADAIKDSTLAAIEDLLNSLLVDTPIVPCQ